MEIYKDIRPDRHCIFAMHVHLVFVTSQKRGVFTQQILDDLSLMFSDVCKKLEGELIEFDGAGNYVHLLINYHPKVSIPRLVSPLKRVSTYFICKKNYPSIDPKISEKSLWSPSYFAGSCGGAPISILHQYIENQKTPD